MQLGSPGAARAELAALFREFKTENAQHGGSFSTFSVSTIPSAQAYHVAGGGQVGENILFANGPFLYLLGEGWSTEIKDPPARSTLIAAVTTLYKRVRDHPPVQERAPSTLSQR
jgi:hypothetical protein